MEITKDLLDNITKLRVDSKFASVIPGLIHNLNTPLMNISGRIEILQFKMPDLKGLDKMTSNLDKINHILTDLTYLVDKSQNKEVQTINLAELIYKIDSMLNFYSVYKHVIDKDFDLDAECTVKSRSYNLINSLYEIYVNILQSFNEESEDAELKTTLQQVDNYHILKIFNTSQPIDKTILDKLFQPFNTNRIGHQGMGLFIANNLLKTVSCELFLENLEGGVLYTIKIPV